MIKPGTKIVFIQVQGFFLLFYLIPQGGCDECDVSEHQRDRRMWV